MQPKGTKTAPPRSSIKMLEVPLLPIMKKKGKGGARAAMNKGVQRASPIQLMRMEDQKKALTMRRRGFDYLDIAIALGVSNSTAYEYVMAAICVQRDQLRETVDAVREMEINNLNELYQRAYLSVADPFQGLEAIKTCLKIQERRSKLLGLDAAVKFEHQVDIPVRQYIGIDPEKV